ncbi:MFS family permease [Methylobacterium sp. RAS18]|nr:MFS family permease [Methylobacterium sp. RAS18]
MTAQKAGVGSGDGLPLRERLLALCAMALAISMAVLDGAIVNVALPVIARDLDVPASEAIFVVSAYQIAVTAALLPLATLGEIWGYRRVYLAGLAVFTVASLACAVSPNLASLTAARVAQGLGAAGIMSVNIALVRFIYPSRLIGRGVGNVALIVAVASAAGPTVRRSLPRSSRSPPGPGCSSSTCPSGCWRWRWARACCRERPAPPGASTCGAQVSTPSPSGC